MTLFLVELNSLIPASLGAPERDALTSRERDRGKELLAMGHIKSIWRVTGTNDNVAIWSAEDHRALLMLLESLPAWPYMEATITGLSLHPLTGEANL